MDNNTKMAAIKQATDLAKIKLVAIKEEYVKPETGVQCRVKNRRLAKIL